MLSLSAGLEEFLYILIPKPEIEAPASVLSTNKFTESKEVLICNNALTSGAVVPIPTLPTLSILTFSVAVSDAPVANTNSVAFTDAENVASASA